MSRRSQIGRARFSGVRRFLMKLAGPPPQGTSVGLVTITDPWDPASSQNFNMVVRPPRADLTAFPSLVTMGSREGKRRSSSVRRRRVMILMSSSRARAIVRSSSIGSGSASQENCTGFACPQGAPFLCTASGEFRLRITASFSKAPLFVTVHIPSDRSLKHFPTAQREAGVP